MNGVPVFTPVTRVTLSSVHDYVCMCSGLWVSNKRHECIKLNDELCHYSVRFTTIKKSRTPEKSTAATCSDSDLSFGCIVTSQIEGTTAQGSNSGSTSEKPEHAHLSPKRAQAFLRMISWKSVGWDHQLKIFIQTNWYLLEYAFACCNKMRRKIKQRVWMWSSGNADRS